jgi:hypothetical protein
MQQSVEFHSLFRPPCSGTDRGDASPYRRAGPSGNTDHHDQRRLLATNDRTPIRAAPAMTAFASSIFRFNEHQIPRRSGPLSGGSLSEVRFLCLRSGL